MKFTEEMNTVIEKSPYITLVTINEDGMPHPIIVGGKKQKEDTISIGIYKMDITQKNLTNNHKAWITAAIMNESPKGYRFEGTAMVVGGDVIFTPDLAEVMI